MFVPSGVHIDSEYIPTNEEPEKDEAIGQAFTYPMGIGGVMMNGCYGTNYQQGDPCYALKETSAICLVSMPFRISLLVFSVVLRNMNTLLQH